MTVFFVATSFFFVLVKFYGY